MIVLEFALLIVGLIALVAIMKPWDLE